MEMITNLNSLCSSCGYFDDQSPLNNGYGCNHKDCEEGEFLDAKGNHITYLDGLIAISFTRRNIKCNRRLAKKFLKKARRMSLIEKTKYLKKLGVNFHGKCFSFSCPISYEVSFDDIKHYGNSKEYNHIESEEDMPQYFGNELMAVGIDFYEPKK